MKASLYDHMGSELRFFIPDLSAHGDEASAPYMSVIAEAAAIYQWLASNGMSRLSLGFTTSLGGVIPFELLCFPDPSFDRLFIEGVGFHSDGSVTRVGGAALGRVMVVKYRGAVRDPETGAHKLQCPYGGEAVRSMVASSTMMNEDGIHAIVRDCSYVSLSPLPPAVQRCCTFTYGEKNLDLRPACRMIPHLYLKAELRVWPGWGYCERMSCGSVAYGAML